MLILKIIAALVVLYVLYIIAIEINKYTQKKYRYLFLNKITLITSLSGYGVSFFGYNWYVNALSQHGDILNGQILMAIGAILLLWTMYTNIDKTGLFTGAIFTVIQQVLYLVVGAAGLFILVLLFAVYAQAKPVYRID
ncbi:hypothetical protein [Sulfurimonas hydrogeniphila]|uniref:hypothetical protein n=1 Tax=Sulfurimonas hydrogeniphila TaxID=2509341 RepID=UPI00125F384A|nr:hypothetical protein [Sulfurimonas hydrogeniphila]